MPDARIAFRPFGDQLAFFRRKINVPTARWDDLRLGDHAHGFMVAGLAREDVLNDLREAIVKAQQGETLDDFRKRFDDIVRGRWEGFTGSGSKKGRAWRTRIIYQTNMRTSYMAGRWEKLRTFPFLQYNHHTIANPRENHLAWDGLIIAINDPWWTVHYPPNGWGCRCDATGVSAQRLRALGRQPDKAPALIQGDPPPEWSYHVGEAARSLPVASAFGERVMQLPPAWRDIALDDAQSRITDDLIDWPALVRLVGQQAASAPIGISAPVGFLTRAIVDGTSAARSAPLTALISVSDTVAIAPALRQTSSLADLITGLPARLASADTSVYVSGDALWYVLADGDQLLRYTFGIASRREADRVTANWLRSIDVVTANDLQGAQLLSGPAR